MGIWCRLPDDVDNDAIADAGIGSDLPGFYDRGLAADEGSRILGRKHERNCSKSKVKITVKSYKPHPSFYKPTYLTGWAFFCPLFGARVLL